MLKCLYSGYLKLHKSRNDKSISLFCQVCTPFMSGDRCIMSDDWTEIEDRIFCQDLKVKLGQR